MSKDIAKFRARTVKTGLHRGRFKTQRTTRVLSRESLEVAHHENFPVRAFESCDGCVDRLDELPAFHRRLGIELAGSDLSFIGDPFTQSAPFSDERPKHSHARVPNYGHEP
jgi:hypothetical protein